MEVACKPHTNQRAAGTGVHRGGDWGKDGTDREGSRGRHPGRKEMVRGQGSGGNGLVLGDCSNSAGVQSRLVDMFVGATKFVITTNNFMCTASRPMFI
jgi:hypothetical protein